MTTCKTFLCFFSYVLYIVIGDQPHATVWVIILENISFTPSRIDNIFYKSSTQIYIEILQINGLNFV